MRFSLLVIILAACGRAPGAATPRDLVVRYVTALENENRAGFDACFEEADVRELAPAFDFGAAGRTFRRAMVEAYGEAGWTNFQDQEGGYLSGLLVFELGDLDRIEIVVDGDRAEVEGLVLRRRGVRWYVDAEANWQAGMAEPAHALARTLRRYAELAGTSGMTVDRIDQEVGSEILEIVR